MPTSSPAVASAPESLTFIEFPRFVLTWPMIAIGLFCGLGMDNVISINAATIMWGLTLTFIIVTMGFEFDLRATLITFLVFGVLGLLGVLITMKWHVPVVSYLLSFSGIQHWKMNKAFMIGVSLIHLTMFIAMLIHCHQNHRWIVTNGSMRRKQLLGSEPDYALDQTHRCSVHYSNHLARFILCNGGDLMLKVGDRAEEQLVIYRVFWNIAALNERIEKFEKTVVSS